MAIINFNWPWTKQASAPKEKLVVGKGTLPPGRQSVSNDEGNAIMGVLKGMTKMVTPSFRTELIPIIRDLYKVNPDMSIVLQDMFKLANTGHRILFPYNDDASSEIMLEHLTRSSKLWSMYTAGIEGLVNKFIVQCLVGGAISIEAVPNRKLSGISTIVFIKPEDIVFHRLNDGVYNPYQINKSGIEKPGQVYIKLNTETYKYSGMFNDTDEPYGVPPFLAALDAIKTQADMQANNKHIMEILGLVGFVEALMEKPSQNPGESVGKYEMRLKHTLTQMKSNIMGGLKDGVMVGYKDDHEFKLNSTTKNLGNIDKVWNMNQQSVANGLGASGNLIGVSSNTSEGGAGILLSKMISQLRNIQMLVGNTLEFIYSLELRMAGLPNKGLRVEFNTSTISDEVKVQQGLEYKIKNLTSLYNQGIISQNTYATEMGYIKPFQQEPRPLPIDPNNLIEKTPEDKDKATKNDSARKQRDVAKPVPTRKDQKTKP